MILKLRLTINRANIMPDSIVVLAYVLKIAFYSTHFTNNLHLNHPLLALTDPLGQPEDLRTIKDRTVTVKTSLLEFYVMIKSIE